MFKIETYNSIAKKGLDRFAKDQFDLSDGSEKPGSSADAIILRSQNLHEMALSSDLLAIGRAGAGTNNIPVEKCSEQGTVVFNTPGANANAVKELVLTGMLLSTRGINEGIKFVDTLSSMTDGAEMAKLLEKKKKQFKGFEIAGKTLGVVGLGAIGSMVANMALALDMKVLGYDPAISVEAAWRLSSRVEKMDSLESLLGRADFVSLHVPALDATKGLINAERLKSAKQGLTILNFAREQVVEAAAVTEALDRGILRRYVTDFPTLELIGRDDTILMPHIGASTEEAEENCAVMAANQLVSFLKNGNIMNSVNFPNLYMERNGGYRITFSNSNVSGVLGEVLSVLAKRNINVLDMLNKSRDKIAYNILDVEQKPTAELLADINEVEHVIRVRAL